jgi:hypothetical protein
LKKWRAAYENVSLLTEMTSESLHYWMERLVLEVRKQDGLEYPPRSLYYMYLVCGLLRYLRHQNIHNLYILDEKNNLVAVFQRVLGTRMKEMSKVLGTKVRQANPLLTENEENIWIREFLKKRCNTLISFKTVNVFGYVLMINTNHWNVINLKLGVIR